MRNRIIVIPGIVLIFLIAIAIIFGGRMRVGLNSAGARETRSFRRENPDVLRVEPLRLASRALSLEAESVLTAVERLAGHPDRGNELADVLVADAPRGDLNHLDYKAYCRAIRRLSACRTWRRV